MVKEEIFMKQESEPLSSFLICRGNTNKVNLLKYKDDLNFRGVAFWD
jgi:hypothetical protein